MDRSSVKCAWHLAFDAGNFIRGRAAPDLFPPCASGAPVIQTTGGSQASWVSAADMMNLMALVLTTFGEFTVLTFSLWLLFRTTFSFRGVSSRGRR